MPRVDGVSIAEPVSVPEVFARVQAGVAPTDSLPLNIGMGAGMVAASGVGATIATGDPFVNGVSAFLNVIAQPIKRIPGLGPWMGIILMTIALIGCLLLVDILFDRSWKQAIFNALMGSLQAQANYKADKIAGTNILQPASELNG